MCLLRECRNTSSTTRHTTSAPTQVLSRNVNRVFSIKMRGNALTSKIRVSRYSLEALRSVFINGSLMEGIGVPLQATESPFPVARTPIRYLARLSTNVTMNRIISARTQVLSKNGNQVSSIRTPVGVPTLITRASWREGLKAVFTNARM